MLQLRPIGSDGPFYSPYRDIAHVGKDIIEKSLEILDKFIVNKDNWDIIKTMTVQDFEEMRQQVSAMVDTINRASTEMNFNPVDEIVSHISSMIKSQNKRLIFSMIGLSFFYAYLTCIRDLVISDDAPKKYIDELNHRLIALTSRFVEIMNGTYGIKKEGFMRRLWNNIRRLFRRSRSHV